jgi:hypothetical protein
MLYSFGPVIDVVDGNSTNYDGISPKGKLLLSGHTLYGTTLGGGNGYGTVFSLRLCLCAPPPVITGIVLNTNQSVTISCLGDPLCKYFMKASTNLVVEMTNWLTISTNFAGTNGRWQVTDPIDLTGISVCSTNYLYGGGIDPNSTGTNVLGTNISCSYLLSPMFYRAAVP